MLPAVVLSAEEVVRIGHGLKIHQDAAPAAEEIAALDEAGRLVAIIGPAGGGLWRPLRNLPF